MADPVPQPTPATPEISRRSFLKLGWGALLGFFASSAGATLRFIFPNVLYEPPQTFNAGARSKERSEEHTSELQSPYDIVCRLLPEKKKPRQVTEYDETTGP